MFICLYILHIRREYKFLLYMMFITFFIINNYIFFLNKEFNNRIYNFYKIKICL